MDTLSVCEFVSNSPRSIVGCADSLSVGESEDSPRFTMSDNTESTDETEQDSMERSSELYENTVPIEEVDEDVDFSWSKTVRINEEDR